MTNNIKPQLIFISPKLRTQLVSLMAELDFTVSLLQLILNHDRLPSSLFPSLSLANQLLTELRNFIHTIDMPNDYEKVRQQSDLPRNIVHRGYRDEKVM